MGRLEVKDGFWKSGGDSGMIVAFWWGLEKGGDGT